MRGVRARRAAAGVRRMLAHPRRHLASERSVPPEQGNSSPLRPRPTHGRAVSRVPPWGVRARPPERQVRAVWAAKGEAVRTRAGAGTVHRVHTQSALRARAAPDLLHRLRHGAVRARQVAPQVHGVPGNAWRCGAGAFTFPIRSGPSHRIGRSRRDPCRDCGATKAAAVRSRQTEVALPRLHPAAVLPPRQGRARVRALPARGSHAQRRHRRGAPRCPLQSRAVASPVPRLQSRVCHAPCRRCRPDVRARPPRQPLPHVRSRLLRPREPAGHVPALPRREVEWFSATLRQCGAAKRLLPGGSCHGQ